MRKLKNDVFLNNKKYQKGLDISKLSKTEQSFVIENGFAGDETEKAKAKDEKIKVAPKKANGDD